MSLDTERLLGILEGKIKDYTQTEFLEAERRSSEIIPGHPSHPNLKSSKQTPTVSMGKSHAVYIFEALEAKDK